MLCLWRGVGIFINLSRIVLGWFQPSISGPLLQKHSEELSSLPFADGFSHKKNKGLLACSNYICEVPKGKWDALSWHNQCSTASFIRVGSHGGLIPSVDQMCWFLTFYISGQKGNKSSLDHWTKALNELKTHKNCCFVLYCLCRISLICANFNYFGKSSCHLLSNISYCLKSNLSSWMTKKNLRFSGGGYL